MNSRERVLTAMSHVAPDRVPVDFDCSQEDKIESLIEFLGVSDKEAMLRCLGTDTRWCIYMDDVIAVNRFDMEGTYTDLWGAERHVRGLYPMSHPLEHAETVRDLEGYRWPQPEDFDFSRYIDAMPSHAEYAVFGGVWSPWMEVADALLGSEKFMIMMLTAPAFIEALVDRIFGVYLEVNRRFFDEAGDAMQVFFCADDYGAQENLLWSPDTWRTFVKPRQKQLYDLAHERGYKVMQHSCGAVTKILPELIEIGLDCLQPIQVTAAGMDPVALKAAFGQDLTFVGAVNGQGAIVKGTPADVEAEVKLRIEQLGAGGGYVVSTSQGIMPDMPNENVLAMYDAVKTHGMRAV